VPAELTIDEPSVKIDGHPAGSSATVSGHVLVVRIDAIDPQTTADISFKTTLSRRLPLGTSIVNIASISADGLAAASTTPASVMLGSSNTIFDGLAGATHPVSGATITMLDASHGPVHFSEPGARNPFVTGSDGAFYFPYDPAEISPAGSRSYFTVAAAGYRNRTIAVDVTPGEKKGLYSVELTALDNQPLAAAGTYTLTSSPVELRNVYGLFANIPLFVPGALIVSETVNDGVAQAGDRLLYTVTFSNAATATLLRAQAIDALPSGVAYGTGSARLDGRPLEPAIAGRMLRWNLGTLTPGIQHTIVYAVMVFPSVAAQTELADSVTVTGVIPGTQNTVSGASSVVVEIVGGVFSQRRVIVGRVFVDAAGTGSFTPGDRGVASVRIYLEDGSYVVTDAAGKFSFPALRPGMHALRLDLTTLPPGVHAKSGAPLNSPYATQRLLHGILDAATMEDVEFALPGGKP
jgi:uncharacterized repeat protein (TIGR01451 family)